ncbi:MAG: fungal-specific transcription factor domain-containing protein [Linnemannia gamsii]|nr:MAG: fungal-specific transcription factor domain-containing protein [Linnemannia gamsii]
MYTYNRESPVPENNSRLSSPSPAPSKDNGNGKKAPAKRIRISIACVSCRHKKIKCDGQVPCSHCIKSSGKCVYPAATKPVNHQYVETLENRLKSVELHLQELLAKGGGGGGAAGIGGGAVDNEDQQHEHTFNTDDSSLSSTAQGSRSTSHFVPLTVKPSSPLSLPVPRRLTGLSSSAIVKSNHTGSAAVDNGSMEVLEILLGNLKVGRDGTAKFLPGLIQQQEESYAKARTYSKPGPPGLSPIMDIPVLDWESSELPKPYTLPTTLLSPKAINALLDLYFKSVHTFLPILHKPSFLTLCQEGEFRVPPFLLMAMCAVASCHANEVELEEISRLDSFKSHHVLFDYARSLLDTYLDVPRLSTLQGLLLLTYYQIKSKRAGQYFRVRSYLGLAVHMALDLGLARDFYVHVEELESSSVFNGVLGHSSSSPSSTLVQQRSGNSNDAQKSKEDKARWTVTQQERHLTWLGCYFLDGISSSLAGQDYCVAHGQLETRKLIRAANGTTDTTQAATLIFWFVHLDLVKQRRRISEMYRVLTLSPNATHDAAIVSSIAESTEMWSIEHALDTWMTTLPVHLVYPGRKSSPSQNGVFAEPSLPSYYTLYLHRFYYSHELLLYRPLINLTAYQGSLSDPKSPLGKCAHAAAMLTEIGETIFQNYRWPWPGCGLFGYHMVQAIEIHVFLMVNYGMTDSQELFYKTMGLLKGFVSLAKLPELEKAILSMEQMVAGYIMNPESVSALQWSNSGTSSNSNNNSPGSVLQRYHQIQRHEEVAVHSEQDASNNSGNNGVSLSAQSSMEHTPTAPAYNSLHAMSMSPISPAISHLMQQHLHMDPQQQQRSHINSPLLNNANNSTTHIYSPLPSNMGFNSLSGAAGSLASNVGTDLLSHHTGQGYGVNPGGGEGLDSTTSTGDVRSQASPISSFLYNMNAPTPMSLYNQSPHDILPYTNYLTSVGSVDDLVNFETMVSPPPQSAPSSSIAPGVILPTPGVRPHHQQQQQQQQQPHTGAAAGEREGQQQEQQHQHQHQQRVTFLAPPKPPKRVHQQFTGSTNSSSKSSSQRPPVPKKPSRLMSTIGGNTSWISPTTPYPNTDNSPYQEGLSSSYGHSHNGNHGRYMNESDDMMTDSTPLLVGQPAPPTARGRPLRVLQAQTQLYGLGALQSPHNRDDDEKSVANDEDGSDVTDKFDPEQYAIDIMYPHLSNKVMHRRPQMI